MSSITDGINGIFFLTISGIICSGFTLAVRYTYKSKCKNVEICCIKITRDIEAEKEEDLQFQQHANSQGESSRKSIRESLGGENKNQYNI